jgi:two-component system CheB/CheR fusion protein
MIRESLRIVADTMPAAAVHCSRERRFLWVNPCYARWVARAAEEIVGQHIADVVGAEAMRWIEPCIERVLKGEQLQYERLARLAGLGERWVSWMYTPTYGREAGAGREPDGWVAIGTDIHDRKLAEEALKHEQQRKEDFLAALAHELRNPLAPIRNAVAILEKKGPLDAEVAYSRAVIERQIDQLSRLIGDLVDVERIARGRFALRKQRVTLESIVDMALESSRAHINAAGHRLSVLLPNERALLEADPARLAQAFATLLKNAAKHTPAQGSIGFSAALEGREVVVSVEDSGAGLAPAAAERLFSGGAGVGLSLAQGIVELHQGRIEARSAGPGRGTEFIVRLPLARGNENMASAGAGPAYTPYPTVRVLVADDNRDAADSLQRVLELFGHEVRVAYDGASALKIGDEFRPRVAVLDIAMPGTSGYDVARAMRRQQGGELTLVALTGWGQEADRQRAIESGFDYHLVKPVDPDALNQLLAEVAPK